MDQVRRPVHPTPGRPQAANPPVLTQPARKDKSGSRRKKVFTAALAVLALAALGAAVYFFRPNPMKTVDRSKYQAVQLVDGQLYFGRIQAITPEIIKLTDIYYFPPQQQSQGNDEQPQLKLNKLGSEIHGPEDAMYLNRRNVIYWENLKNDSKLVQTIKSQNN